MTIATFNGISYFSIILTILAVVGFGCYLWYLFIQWCEKNYNLPSLEYDETTEETKEEIKEEPKIYHYTPPKKETNYPHINEQREPSYKIPKPYYPIRERISYGFDEPKKETVTHSFPKTVSYSVDTTGKRNITKEKLSILLLDKIGDETVRKLQDDTVIIINGMKKITQQKSGRKYTKMTTFMTIETTKKNLLELMESNEMKQHERNKVTPKLREIVKVRDNYTCQICGKHMPDNVGLHIDHIIPINKGGKSTVENLQVLCSVCNGRKSDKVEGE